MVVDGIRCAETDLLKSLREVVGDDVIVSASLDLHGNISVELSDYVNILTAYRTAPHTDYIETRKKTAKFLVNSIQRKLKPKSLIIKPPVLLPGEYVVTNAEPAASLYERLDQIDKIEGVMDFELENIDKFCTDLAYGRIPIC